MLAITGKGTLARRRNRSHRTYGTDKVEFSPQCHKVLFHRTVVTRISFHFAKRESSVMAPCCSVGGFSIKETERSIRWCRQHDQGNRISSKEARFPGPLKKQK